MLNYSNQQELKSANEQNMSPLNILARMQEQGCRN